MRIGLQPPSRFRDADQRPAARSRGPMAPPGDRPRGGSVTASAIWSPTLWTGLSEVIGSWKIIEISLPRIARISCSGRVEQIPHRARPGPGTGREPADLALRRRRRQAHDGEAGDALARAGLAHQRQRLARPDREGNIVDGRHLATVGPEGDGEVCGHRERMGIHVQTHHATSSRASSASRRPSPMKLKLVTASVITRPGRSPARGRAEVLLGVVQHVAPARQRRLDAVAEEADVGFHQDRAGDGQRRRDHDRADRVGDQLAEHDVRSDAPIISGGDREVALAQGADLALDDAGDLHPAGRGDDQRDRHHAGLDEAPPAPAAGRSRGSTAWHRRTASAQCRRAAVVTGDRPDRRCRSTVLITIAAKPTVSEIRPAISRRAARSRPKLVGAQHMRAR